jgi:HK97 family phage prohead protease
MAIKNDREYRNFNGFALKRAEGEESFIVEGYASTFESYQIWDFGDEEWREQIMPEAFNEADMTDVVFLRDHAGQVFARTKNNTIAILPDERGLFTRTNLSSTSASRGMYEDIEAGLYSQMSFAFTVDKQHFEEKLAEDGKRIITRFIDSIKKVYDISAVAFPANPTTDIGISTRSIFDGAIEELRAERLEEQRARNEEARKRLAVKFKLEKEN